MTQQINTTPPRMRSRATGGRVTEEEVNREDSFDREDHQSAWEDEEGDIFHVRHSRAASPSGSSVLRSPRKRRRPVLVTKGSKKQVSTKSITTVMSSQVAAQPDEVPVIAREDVVNGLLHGSLFTSKYALDVFKRALHLLRYPLSFLFFLYLLAFIINKMEQTLRTIFSPICVVPGISRSRLCHTPVPPVGNRPVKWADYPHLVDVESKTFEQLMDGVVGGSALSLEVKQAEMATTDLVTLVRISDLKAKDMLANSLLEFIETAKKTGRGLQKMSSKVGGTVDSIMAANEYALKTIEAARANEPPWYLSGIVPWARKSTNLIVTETFEEAMDTLSRHLQRLIVEAEINDRNLNDLEEHLNSIHELVTREDSSISSAKSDLLADLWTQLGGNRKKLRNFDSHLGLLKDLTTYRKQAVVHVAAALQTLRGMAEDMEDMRERVAAPDLLGSSVPVEVHMKSIENGLESLKEGRVRAKKLQHEAMQRILFLNGSEDE